MLKRYFKSLIALKYAKPLTACAIAVFFVAIMRFKTESQIWYWASMVICGVMIVFFAFVQYEKYRTVNQLKGIKQYEKFYNDGGMLGNSFVLEDRILLCTENLKIKEFIPRGVKSMNVTEKGKEKYAITLTWPEESVCFVVDNKIQAERFAAYMKRKNEQIDIRGIEPKGNGTLKELGAIR